MSLNVPIKNWSRKKKRKIEKEKKRKSKISDPKEKQSRDENLTGNKIYVGGKRKTVIESEINVFYFFFMKLRRNILVRKKIYTKV